MFILNLQTIILNLFKAFEKPLPGANAHLEMAPYRRNQTLNFDEKQPKIASTLLLLYPKKNEIYFCLIERQEYKGIHSSQISFPGGRNENGETIKQTAVRETMEEIGVDPLDINIIGELTQVYIPPSNFLIHPFIGYCDIQPNFKANSREVKKIIEVNLNDLFKKDVIKKKKMIFSKNRNSISHDVPYFDLNNQVVWGATSVILNEFRKILKL